MSSAAGCAGRSLLAQPDVQPHVVGLVMMSGKRRRYVLHLQEEGSGTWIAG
jgi:hypothetical protein